MRFSIIVIMVRIVRIVTIAEAQNLLGEVESQQAMPLQLGIHNVLTVPMFHVPQCMCVYIYIYLGHRVPMIV